MGHYKFQKWDITNCIMIYICRPNQIKETKCIIRILH